MRHNYDEQVRRRDRHKRKIELRERKRKLKKRKEIDAQISPIGAVLLIGCVVLLCLMAWFLSLPPSCSEESQKELIGTLSGFKRNASRWDVQINNKSFVFDRFDSYYMASFISKNVTLTCCERRIGDRQIYAMLSCYLTNVKEGI